MLFLQAVTMTGPGWVGPAVAISLMIIAAGLLGVSIAAIIALRKIGEAAAALRRLEEDAAPALGVVRQVAEQGQEVAAAVRGEILALVETSRQVRVRLDGGITRVQERLADLQALYDVVEEELEETALDVAATLRRLRLGTSLATRLRRTFRRHGR